MFLLSTLNPSLLLFALILSHLHSPSQSSSSIIETSSVSYCADPLAILIDTFDVRYSRSNSTLEFDLSAASIASGLNLEAQLALNAYGRNALNLSIDLCSVLSGVLCPLPTYNFTGSGQYPIPANRIPSIPSLAWTVPDIEAVFTIQLIDSSSNLSAACLQVTLTNGLTVGLPSVVWASASLLILSALIALLAAIIAPSSALLTTPASFFYLIGNQLQLMATNGMLSLNYPVVLRTWTTNFAYSVGLISSSPISRAIDNLRDHTGGNGFRTSQDTVAFISRRFSPYNQKPGTVDTHTDTSSSARALLALARRSLISTPSIHSSRHNSLVTRATSDSTSSLVPIAQRPGFNVPVVTRNTTLLDPGLAAYVNKVGFPVENAYMLLFMWLLILTAFLIGCFLVTSFFLLIIPSRNPPTRRLPRLDPLRPVTLAIGLRVLLFAYPPLSLFTFWQWKLGSADAWFPILLSVLVWLGSSVALSFIAWRLFRHYCHHEVWEWSTTLVGMFKPGRWWLMGPLSLIALLRVAFIGFGQGSGQTQVISEMILFFLQFVLLLVYRPFGARLTNVAAIIQTGLAVIQSIILQFLVPALEIDPIPRAILGFVMIGVHSIGLLTVIIFGGWPLIGELKTVINRDRGERLSVLKGDDQEKTIKEQDEMIEHAHDPRNNRDPLIGSQEAEGSEPSSEERGTGEDTSTTLGIGDDAYDLRHEDDIHFKSKDRPHY